MIATLVRALVERAEEVVRWETGDKANIVMPRLVSSQAAPGAFAEDGETIEFRVTVPGMLRPSVYVVTVSEVVTKR